MAQALPMVKQMILALMKSQSKIPTWVLTSFNDPKVKLVKKSSNVKDLISGLKALKYGGGRDLPEQALKGSAAVKYVI